MPVAPITYAYLILTVASFWIIVIATFRKDPEKALTFFICMMLFAIGFSSNYQICPMWFCIGAN
jgi:hypothetical protein